MTEPGTKNLLSALAALALLTVPVAAVSAQGDRMPTIEEVRIGLPYRSGEAQVGHTRQGSWAPVYVKLHTGTVAVAPGSLRLVITSSDSEGAEYRYDDPLPTIEPEKDYFAITYIRPGSSEVTVSLRNASDKATQFQIRGPDGRPSITDHIAHDFYRGTIPRASLLYLAIGSRLPGLQRALLEGTMPDLVQNAGLSIEELSDERSSRKLSYIDNVVDLPGRWFGYDAVDIAVLSTSNDSFVRQLLEDRGARTALGEWVRRGGKLVIAAGRNRQLVVDLLDKLPLSESDKQPLIDCKIEGAITAKGQPSIPARVLTRWATAGREPPPVLEFTELTRLVPNARPEAESRPEPVNALIREAALGGEHEGPPIVVHSGCGLGRVILLAFDPDTAPFNSWAGQKTFWEKLENELQPQVAVSEQDGKANRPAEVDLAGDLKRALEGFLEVPVVSFGWVALFILVYILIVGPLDYLILKKVFKRLELTWITFPTVVIAISVAAYFAAYSLKGNDLRINKIDVIDYDLHGRAPQAYGNTWVTLFSPRIQNYTIGLEPAGPGGNPEESRAWVGAPGDDARAAHPLVTVMEGSESSSGRIGTQALFRRSYEYAPDATGLRNVSIPVWSMRTFTGRWRAPLPAAHPPIEVDLRHARDKDDPSLVGRIKNNLPVELTNLTIVYKGRAYSVSSISPGTSMPIDDLKIGEKGKQASQWLTEGANLTSANQRVVTSPLLFRELLFYSWPAPSNKFNGGWRWLDQSWRLRTLTENSTMPQPQSVYREDVVLVARVPSRADRSEIVAADDASPTRLWLDVLPEKGAKRPALNGYLVQDVYVRVFSPVNP